MPGQELDAATAALATAEAAVAEPARLANEARQRVLSLAALILAAPCQRLLAEAKAARADLVARRVGLRFLLHKLQLEGPEHDAIREFLRQNELPGTFGSIDPNSGTGPLSTGQTISRLA